MVYVAVVSLDSAARTEERCGRRGGVEEALLWSVGRGQKWEGVRGYPWKYTMSMCLLVALGRDGGRVAVTVERRKPSVVGRERWEARQGMLEQRWR